MATTAPINTNPFCDVELYSLAESGLNDKFVVRLENPDEAVEAPAFLPISTKGAIHGDGYQLVPNTRVQQITEDVLTRTGMDFLPLSGLKGSRREGISWDGKRFASRWFVPDVNAYVDDADGSGRSKLMLGVEALNSYDGSYGVALQFFVLLFCSHTPRSTENFEFFSGDLSFGFSDQSVLLLTRCFIKRKVLLSIDTADV